MNNNWYEFKEDGHATRRRTPRVSLTKHRRFRFNEKALELIGSPKAVRFLFDVQLSRIGIRAEDPEADHSFRLCKEDKSRTQIVSGALFCDSLGIRPEHTIEFQSVRTDDEGTLLLDLTTARRKVSSYGGSK
ncbi:MAG: hypothetical protein ABL984_13870 [Pyrinomonadaceae bacterium]